MNGLVSVITPTYNRAYCLGRTLDSALAQTYPHLEIVLVDDGSSDNTGELVRARYGHDPRVRYLHQENGGVSAARNRGLREARGDYLAFLDSDDVWKPWKLQAQLACLNHVPDAGMIWSDMAAVGRDGHAVSPRYLRTMYSAYRWFPRDELFRQKYDLRDVFPDAPAEVASATFHAGDVYSPMIMGNLVHTSTVVLTRARFEKVGLFNEAYRPTGEDYDFHLRTCRAGPVAYLDLASIEYQLDSPDCLTKHLYATAVHFLHAVTAALARDRDRITLPPALVRHVLAEGHAWVAEELLVRGEPRQASHYFARSLRYRPWQPRVLAQLARCALPRRVEQALMQSYRWLKGQLRKAAA